MYWSIRLLQEEVERLEDRIESHKRTWKPEFIKPEISKCKKLIDDYNSAIEILLNHK
jgi:hypothetical protein